uniref:Thioredoxin domain-containing protein n=1 Tax=Setaria digitata TaxID=48799 RepID=A0A915PVL1_9BILA
MAQLLADIDLKKADGTIKKGSEALANKKVVALYFSAHWCPKCRQFTPILKDFYEEVDDDQFEIVFVSLDRSEEDLITYVKESHGDWYYIPYGSDEILKLKNKYEVVGIPMLIVIKADGNVITSSGRTDISDKAPQQTLSSWLAAA